MTGVPTHSAKIRHHTLSLTGISPEKTDEGFYVFRDVKVARTGLFEWACVELASDGIKQAFPDLRDGDIVNLQRDSISPEAVKSLDLKPITNNHPSEGLVTPKNATGTVVGAIGEGSYVEGEWLYAKSIIVYDESSKLDLESGKVEVSIGYTYETPVDFVKDLPYVAKEVIIYINHVAIVNRGRAGSECRFNEELNNQMNETEIKVIQDDVKSLQLVNANLVNRLNSLEDKFESESKPEGKEDEHVSKNSDAEEECLEKTGVAGNSEAEGSEGGEEDGSEDKPEDGEKERADRKNQGEISLKKFDEIIVEAEAAYKEENRGNDMFYTSLLSMLDLLKQVSTNGLIGIKNGKGFGSKEHTRANSEALTKMIDDEIATRSDVSSEGDAATRENGAVDNNDSFFNTLAI